MSRPNQIRAAVTLAAAVRRYATRGRPANTLLADARRRGAPPYAVHRAPHSADQCSRGAGPRPAWSRSGWTIRSWRIALGRRGVPDPRASTIRRWCAETLGEPVTAGAAPPEMWRAAATMPARCPASVARDLEGGRGTRRRRGRR